MGRKKKQLDIELEASRQNNMAHVKIGNVAENTLALDKECEDLKNKMAEIEKQKLIQERELEVTKTHLEEMSIENTELANLEGKLQEQNAELKALKIRIEELSQEKLRLESAEKKRQ